VTDLIQLNRISRSYGGIHALNDVSFTLRAGEVHALVGENGAGKSTLMRVLGGETVPEQGEILIDGMAHSFARPIDSIRQGISIIHQEMALADDLSVAENIFLGELPASINFSKLNVRAGELIRRLGFNIDPRAQVGELSVAHAQVVEIAKALSRNARVIVFDEPTAVLSVGDAKRLLDIIRVLRKEGVAIVYISHRLDEIFAISDRISVLKDGRNVGTVAPQDQTIDDLIRMMVGRPLTALFGERLDTTLGDVVLEVRDLTLTAAKVTGVNFAVRAGEILGLGGLVGSGRTELVRAIFGADPIQSGTITLRGKLFRPRNPRHAVRAGIGLVPEDRKAQGVVLNMSIRHNMTMAGLDGMTNPFGFIRNAHERGTVARLIDNLRVKLGDMSDAVSSLSGGNQQKVVLAKWFHVNGDVMILDEPTRGVDVGAKAEIYSLIHRLAHEGKAVIVISSEHLELFGLCDRVVVMGEGQLRGELAPDQYSEENLLALAMRREPMAAKESMT
jgi:ribose transport system ATP-binding protein